ncbi:hypothetical protein EBI_25944 [Enterocytozoon bieneusi H348]|nr:hypothetical protein EBI_25944 [Enterocytozoon bieneusi H348]|eukprot:XP_002651028.1 hypothetical protein EBI_25944 [Enterocytozoon bieneusi H348]
METTILSGKNPQKIWNFFFPPTPGVRAPQKFFPHKKQGFFLKGFSPLPQKFSFFLEGGPPKIFFFLPQKKGAQHPPPGEI